jgi:hypothetical protein
MTLTKHSLQELKNLDYRPIPTCSINPGVVNKLIKEGFAKNVYLKSPFPSHKGGDCSHLEITEKGREFLEMGGINAAY